MLPTDPASRSPSTPGVSPRPEGPRVLRPSPCAPWGEAAGGCPAARRVTARTPLPQARLAGPRGTDAWTRPRPARRTRAASSSALSTWRSAWAAPRRAAVPAAAAAAPYASSSPVGRRRTPWLCSSARARARRAPNAGVRPSCPRAPSPGPVRPRPPASSPATPASAAVSAGACRVRGRRGARAGHDEARAAHALPPLRRPRLLAFQASCVPAPGAPDGCLRGQGARCLRAYAGLVGKYGGLRGGAGLSQGRLLLSARPLDPALGILIGTAVTPNYVDNSSARVAPWCDCGASGNRREDCEAFRGLFTRNPCLGEG